MKKIKLAFYFSLIFSTFAHAIVPYEDIRFPQNKDATDTLVKEVSENELNEIINRITKIYADFVMLNYQSKLVFDKDWKDDTINAYASRPVDGEFHIHVPGGIVRAKGMTKDGVAVVLCHELGHHLGGAPRSFLFNGWPSAEGQADYWATSKCLKRYFYELRDEDVSISSNIPDKIVKDCNSIFPDFVSMKICVRTILASLDFANFLNQLPSTKVAIKLETPDSKVVKGTNMNDYPRPQCRFDTLYQGALCNVSPDAMTSITDPTIASCMNLEQLGARPRCWFAK